MIKRLWRRGAQSIRSLSIIRLIPAVTLFMFALLCFSGFYSIGLYRRFILSYPGILAFIAIGYSLDRGNHFNYPQYKVSFLYVAWIVIVYLSRGDIYLWDNETHAVLVSQCILCGLVLPFSIIGKDVQRRKYLDMLFCMITCTMAALIWLCFIAVLRGENIVLLDDRFIFGALYTYTNRIMLKVLNLHYYHLGFISTACFFMTLYLACSHRKRRLLPLWLFFLGTFTAGILLTYARTSVFSFTGGLLMAFHILLQRTSLKKEARRILFPATASVCIFLTGAGMNVIYKAVHSIRDIWYGISTLSSRTEIWGALIPFFREHPSALLFGMQPEVAMPIINEYLPQLGVISHMHSGYLQTLLALGIPGFLCALVFTFFLIQSCIRVFFAQRGRISNAVKMLCIIPAVSVCMAAFDNTLFMGNEESIILSLIFMFVSGYLFEIDRMLTHTEPEAQNQNSKASSDKEPI